MQTRGGEITAHVSSA